VGVLEDLYTLAQGHEDPQHPHAAATLRTMTLRPESVAESLRALGKRGWAAPAGGDAWALTPEGLDAARRYARARDEEASPPSA
jgi:hypothetical protein